MVEPGTIPNGIPLLMMLPVGLFVFIGIIVLGIIDLYYVLFKKTSSSVSQFLITTAFRSPFVSFTFGCVVAHLFFYMYPAGESSGIWERLSYAVAGAGVFWGIQQIIFGFKNKGK